MIAFDGLFVLALLAVIPAILYNLWRSARAGGATETLSPLEQATAFLPPEPPMSRTEMVRQARVLADGVRDEYGGYLLDPIQAFRYPLLNQVTAPSTQRFLLALAAYNAAEPEQADSPGVDAAQLLDLARDLRAAWVTAYDHAQIVGLEYLSAPHRERVQRAIKALHLALDPGSTDAERHSAYRYALRLVHGIVDVHRRTMGALEQQIDQLELEGGHGDTLRDDDSTEA